MKLDGDVHRARNLEDRRRDVAVECDLAVRIIVRQHDVMAATRSHHALEVLAWRDGRSGIVRIVQVDELRALQNGRGNLFELEEKVRARREIVQIRLGIRQHSTAMIDGVSGNRHDRGVSGVEHRRRQMRDPFFGAEQRMELGERIHGEAEAALHVAGGGFAECRQAELKRVAAHRGILDGAGESFHRDARRREIGVPRPDIDYIDALLNEPPLDRG